MKLHVPPMNIQTRVNSKILIYKYYVRPPIF